MAKSPMNRLAVDKLLGSEAAVDMFVRWSSVETSENY